MKLATLTILASVGLAAPAMAGPGSLVSIGDLPGGPVVSEAFGISPDGTIVVGYSAVGGANQGRAVAWTKDGGLVNLGLQSGGVMRNAYAVNNNGQFCGEIATSEAAKGSVTGSAITILPGTVPNGFFGSSGLAISDSGTRVAGSRELSGFVIEACYWDGTTVQSIGNLSSFPFLALAQGISGDGSVIVGQTDTDDGYEAFRYTAGGGLVGLGTLPGAVSDNSNGNGISRDGSIIVGSSTNSSGGTRACKWTDAGQIIVELPGQSGFGDALAANTDGSVIVGRASLFGGQAEAVLWDANGVHTLADLLLAKGVDASTWTLKSANSVSGDGTIVVGTALDIDGNTVGFVANLGTDCPADVNNDGTVDLGDFFDFFNGFDQSIFPADVNYDQQIDLADFFEFFNRFDASC